METSEIEIRQVFSADDFGTEYTPELREQEAAIRAKAMGLGNVRFEASREMSIAGINESYDAESRVKIPAQWERFAPQIGKVPGQVGKDSYGVCWNCRPGCVFDYLTGVEVADTSKVSSGFTSVKVPARRHAVLAYEGNVSNLPQAIEKIWSEWVPESGLKIADAPCFERYTEEFNPKTGSGGIEIWIPLEG
jgi:predicted transcriptional regulator YdeE